MQKKSRASGLPLKYGIAGAGTVRKSLIGRLPGKAIGPVAAVSLRVASRVANTLPGGYAVRTPDGLDGATAILFYSSPDQMAALLQALEDAPIDWTGKSLIVCDCEIDRGALDVFRQRGASIALARQFEIPGYLIVEGAAPALLVTHRIARELRLKTIEIAEGTAACFETAVTMSTSALTPLIDSAAALLRRSGVREIDAARLAAALFQRTAAEYSHSGKQSWSWYLRGPEPATLERQLDSTSPELGTILRQLLLYGFDLYGKHPAAAARIASLRK